MEPKNRRNFLTKLAAIPVIFAAGVAKAHGVVSVANYHRKQFSSKELDRFLDAIGYNEGLKFPCRRVVSRHVEILKKLDPQTPDYNSEQIEEMALEMKNNMMNAFHQHIQGRLTKEEMTEIMSFFESSLGKKTMGIMEELQRVGAPFVDRGPQKLKKV